jgi:hypothetical protein
MVPQILLLMICLLGLWVPFIQTKDLLRWVLYGTLIVIGFFLVRSLFARRPVVVMGEGFILIRGVRPGAWKLFQLWRTENIPDRDVVSVRIGYLRKQLFGNLVEVVPGEPSRGAVLQAFLWIDFLQGGVHKSVYYPHIMNICRFDELIALLTARFGVRVENRM